MKIAIFHELHEGGALRAAISLSRKLSASHTVVMYSIGEVTSPATEPFAIRNIPFRSLQKRGILGRIRHDFFDLIRLGSFHLRLAYEIDSAHYDIVLVHPSRYTQAPFLLSFLRTPSVYYCQEPLRLVHDPMVATLSGLPLVHRFYERVNRMWRKGIDDLNVRAAGTLLANSQFSRRWIARAYGRSAKVCYLGVDTTLFQPVRVAKKYDVLFLGAPVAIEGYPLLRRAWERSGGQWKIRIVSRGKNGEGVTDRELVRSINMSRLVVCLSHSEPFGLTAIEAASCGVPVVAVDEGGYAESVIHGKTGILVDRDAQKLGKEIRRLLHNKEMRSKLGQAARRNVLSNWTWEKSVATLEKQLLAFMRRKTHDDWQLPTTYVVVVIVCLLFFRLSFRFWRGVFPVQTGLMGEAGYAAYFGYPQKFETYFFNFLFAIPVLVALLMRWRKKREI